MSNTNNTVIYLSSGSTSTTISLDTVFLTSPTNLTLNLSKVSRHKTPINTTIRWGDNTPDIFTVNNFLEGKADLNVVEEMTYGADHTILKEYSHLLSTVQGTLQTNLTSQVLVKYYDNSSCLFNIPIVIISPSFYTKIEDINIVNTNFFNIDGSILYTFNTGSDNSIIEAALYTNN